MFIDILYKQPARAMWVGKQAPCSTNNAGVRVRLLVAPESIAGMLRFQQVDHIPVELQTGGSLDGLDECAANGDPRRLTRVTLKLILLSLASLNETRGSH